MNPSAVHPSPVSGPFSSAERDALLVLAYLHLEQARAEEAAVLLRPLHQERRDDGEVERCLALAELWLGRAEVAAALAAHAYPQTPDSHRSAIGLIYAKALWLAGDAAAAREVLLKLLPSPSRGA